MATGWTPDQVWQMRPRDLATVMDVFDERAKEAKKRGR